MEVKIEYGQNPSYTINQPYNSNPAYSNNPAYPRPVEVQNDVGCFHHNQRNKPQSNSAGAAALILVTGGMNFAWGCGFASVKEFKISVHMQICWFIAAIIGAIVGAALYNHLQKKLIYLFSCVLVVVGGILLVSLSRDSDAIIAARYLNGFANGLVLVSTLVMIGEQAVKSIRGMLASSLEAMCFSLGIFLEIIYTFSSTNWGTSSFDLLQMQGVLSIGFGIISFIIAFFLTIESPIFYLTRDQEELAFDAIRRLQRPFVVTTETYEQFEEHKYYVAINKDLSCGQSAIVGLTALLKLCFYRGLVALSFTSLLTSALFISSITAYRNATWPYIIYGALRWLGVFVSAFIMDSVGRKKPMLFAALVCGSLIIGIGSLTKNLYYLHLGSNMEIALYLLFVFQFFAGVFHSSSSAYLSEAFPLAVKPYYIAISFCTEMLIQIIVITSDKTLTSVGEYCYTFGAFILVFFVLGIKCLPETKHTTLSEADEKFRKFISSRD